MVPTFEAMAQLGWNVIHVPNGHDLQAVYLRSRTASPRQRRITSGPSAFGPNDQRPRH
jgi:hypothetical protein